MSIQNGGSTTYNGHPSIPNSWAEDHVSVDYILGVSIIRDGMGFTDSIIDSNYYINEWGLPENLILLCGDGHSWIALDYNKSLIEPPVVYVDIEVNQKFILANNFEDFINGLSNYE